MKKPFSWDIEVKMFTRLIFQNIMVMINAFQACMIKVGYDMEGWDILA